MKRKRDNNSKEDTNDPKQRNVKPGRGTKEPSAGGPKPYKPAYKEKEDDLHDNLDYVVSLGHQITRLKALQEKWLNEKRNRNTFQLVKPQTNAETCHDNDDDEHQNQIKTTTNNDYLSPVATYISEQHTTIPKQQYSRTKKLCVHAEDNGIYSSMKFATKLKKKQKIHLKEIAPSIYSSNESLLFTWPIKNISKTIQKFNNDTELSLKNDAEQGINLPSTREDEWELEYGDDISYLELKKKISCTHLSNENNKEDDSASDYADGNNNDKLVLEEMMHKAWERAVHLTSSTFVIATNPLHNISDAIRKDRNHDEKHPLISRRNIPTPPSNRIINKNDETDDTDYEVDKIQSIIEQLPTEPVQSVLKCKALGITFDPIEVFNKHDGEQFFTCQVCKRDIKYKTNKQALEHLFGGADGVAGCCWKIIQSKHLKIIKTILDREGLHIVDGLLHILIDRASKKKNEENEKLNWIDVIQLMEEELASSRNRKGSKFQSNCFDTHKVRDEILALPLNKDTLEVVTRNAIRRYGISEDV